MTLRYLPLLFVCQALFFSRTWGADFAVGKLAPVIEAKLLDSSKKVQAGSGTGKVTIINFWASWCAPCRAEMPAIQSFYDKHKS